MKNAEFPWRDLLPALLSTSFATTYVTVATPCMVMFELKLSLVLKELALLLLSPTLPVIGAELLIGARIFWNMVEGNAVSPL
ncbi:hypothetical protein B0H19DRAFT_1088485 [Mycena capillaripes]|nr:hypothetical protein B0H19DRAFT_1088485 [Mycena capillaripes]